MTAATARAPYEYVVAEQPVRDVERLLVTRAEDELVISDWYRRVRLGSHRSLLELEGLGAEIWADVDAKKYVDELRNEWNHR